MFSSLLSLLLLGAVSADATPAPNAPLPGIEVLQVSSPTPMNGDLRMPERISASGVLLLDLQSGETLLARSPDQRRAMASLTKIMTALLVLEHRPLRTIVTVPEIADEIRGSTIGMKTGERFTVSSLLKALLIASANDAAYALAVADGRTIGTFVQKMNARAQSLGLRNTHFTNPAGLDNEQQYTTPRDLGWLTMAALKNAEFRSIVNTKSARISTVEGRTFDLRNTNELLHEHSTVSGVKTGTTDSAGECLIILFEERGHFYLLVLLGSKDRYTDSLYILQAVQKAPAA